MEVADGLPVSQLRHDLMVVQWDLMVVQWDLMVVYGGLMGLS